MSDFKCNHAAAIGVDSYSGGITPLTTAVADARAVGRVLEEDHAYRVHMLPDAEATHDHLVDFFEERLRREVGPEDRLVVYFAGHGLALDECGEGPRGYLLPHDARAGDEAAWLSMSWLHRALSRLACRHLLVVLDCCFAGSFRWASVTRSFLPQGKLYDSQYERFVNGTAWQVLTSAAHNEKALDVAAGVVNHRDGHPVGEGGDAGPAGAAHSPFAEALIRGLRGAADSSRGGFDPDGVITATELHQYVCEELISHRPGVAAVQTPGLWPLKPESSGEFVFLVPGCQRSTFPDPPLREETNPWPGLSAYTEDSADVFFGRARAVRMLEQRLLAASPSPVLALVGASGAGKSSLARAGLAHRLLSAEPPWSVEILDHLGDDAVGKLTKALTTLSQAAPPDRSLLVIDQLEELFTQCHDTSQRDTFLRVLTAALGQDGHRPRAVVTLRSDFEPLVSASSFGDLAFERFLVPPLTRDELRQVVVQPAQVRAIYFDPPGLIEKLLDEVATVPGPLPLLSFALSEMYRQSVFRRRRSGDVDRALTEADFEAAGGVVGSVHRRATELYESFPAASRDTVRRVFLRMISTEGGQLARRRVARRELDFADRAERDRVGQVLDEFTEARLLVASSNYVEPAHDTLVLAWPKLNAWRAENGESLALLRSVWWSALEWESSRGDRHLLWDRNPRLPELEASWHELNRLEQSFVRASKRRQQWKKVFFAGTTLVLGGTLSVLTTQAFKKARLARSRLRDALEVADEIVFTVDHDLRSIAGTAAVRRKLLGTTSQLLDRLHADASGDANTHHSRLVNHLRRADLARSHEDLAQVEKEYSAAVAIAESLVAAQPGHLGWQHDLAHCRGRLANTARALGDLGRAEALYEASRRILEELVREEPGRVEWRRELAVRYSQQGSLARERGDVELALAFYEKSLELKRRLAEEDPGEPGWRQELFISYDKLGRLAAARGAAEQARSWFEEGLRLKQALADEDPGNPHWQRALAYSCDHLGELAQDRGALGRARGEYERSLELREALAASDPGNSFWQHDLATSYDHLGALADLGGDRGEARTWYENSFRIYRALTRVDPRHARWQEGLARSRSRLAAAGAAPRGARPVDTTRGTD